MNLAKKYITYIYKRIDRSDGKSKNVLVIIKKAVKLQKIRFFTSREQIFHNFKKESRISQLVLQ